MTNASPVCPATIVVVDVVGYSARTDIDNTVP